MNDIKRKMNDRLAISLLGGLEIKLNDQAVAGFASSKAEALLAYLACNPGVHNRERLATMLWDNRPQERAMGNLRVLLNSIRNLLPQFISITRQTVSLRIDDNVQIDVLDFERMIAEVCGHEDGAGTLAAADVARLEHNLPLYRGEFLAGFFVRSAREFDAWVTFERERLQHRVVTCIEMLVDTYLQQGSNSEGVAWAKTLTQLEPYHERGHQQMLLLLYADNQRPAAIAHYNAYQQMLTKEMGIGPSPETTAIYDRIRRGLDTDGAAYEAGQAQPQRSLLETPMTSVLPVELTTMVGREQEVIEIMDLLADANCRLLTLIGMGGVGKTRLALAVVRKLIEDREGHGFDDGIFYVSLEKVNDPTLITTAIADTLGIRLTIETADEIQVKSYLRRRRLLLVLDNFEHLLAGADLLLSILQAAPSVKMLVTSREILDFHGEQLFEVSGLLYPEVLAEAREDGDVQLLESYSAIRLYEREAKALTPSFSLASEYEAVVEICQHVEGLPLAIQLAAASVRAFPSQQILARIQQNLDFLQTTMRNVPMRHQSLRAVFEHSWALLSTDAQRAFAQLSVFAGTFTPDAAEQVAGVTVSQLLSLVNASLIEQVKSAMGQPTRYKIHATLRQYAEEKLSEHPNVLRAAHDRHSAYFIAFLEEYKDASSKQVALGDFADIAAEIENCRTAWQWAVLHDKLHWAQRALPALGSYYLLHGPFQEGSSLILTAIEELHTRRRSDTAGTGPSKHLLVELSAVQAKLYNRQAAYEDAVQAGLATIDLSSGEDEVGAKIEGHLATAQAYRYLGNYQETIYHAEHALMLARQHRLRHSEAESLLGLGTVRLYQSEYESARDALTDALAIYRALANRQNESRTLNVMGNLYLYQGRYQEARSYYEQSLRLYQNIGDRQGEAQILNNLGAIHFHVGDFAQARSHYEHALVIEQEIGGMQGVSLTSGNLSLLLQYQGDYAGGLTYGLAARTIARELGARDNEAFALLCIGHAQAGLEQWHDAHQSYGQALLLRQDLGQENQALEPKAGLIRVALASGMDDAVLASVEEILTKLQENSLIGIVEPFRIYWTCYLALRTGNGERAAKLLEQAYQLLRQRTELITNTLQRHTYINNWPARRAIMEEYLQRGSQG